MHHTKDGRFLAALSAAAERVHQTVYSYILDNKVKYLLDPGAPAALREKVQVAVHFWRGRSMKTDTLNVTFHVKEIRCSSETLIMARIHDAMRQAGVGVSLPHSHRENIAKMVAVELRQTRPDRFGQVQVEVRRVRGSRVEVTKRSDGTILVREGYDIESLNRAVGLLLQHKDEIRGVLDPSEHLQLLNVLVTLEALHETCNRP